MKPTERFSGLADIYAVSRPSYPPEAIDFIVLQCQLGKESLVVDVGCGTGISTILFSERGIKVIGIEPNDDMRRSAVELNKSKERGTTEFVTPEFRAGTAEDTMLPEKFADAVISAQAFHWFDDQKALAEFHRILKPGGHAILMWNERDESNDFTRGYGDLFRTLPETASVEMKRGIAGEPIMTNKLFCNAAKTVFFNQQKMNLEGVIGRVFSASYAPQAGEPAERLKTGFNELFHRCAEDGMVTMNYETSVYIAQRRPE